MFQPRFARKNHSEGAYAYRALNMNIPGLKNTAGFCLALTVVLAVGAAPVLFADDEVEVHRLTVSPSAEPVPALKYELLPDIMEEIDGNAAVYLGKEKAEETAFFSKRDLWEKIEERWQTAPLEELRSDEQTMILLGDGPPYYYLNQAARCRYCDWQLPYRRETFYTILLPEIQESRQFARILACRARIQIARGKLDEALKTFQTGYGIGRHVADNETLVGGLVGIAMCGSISEQVLEYIQQPDAPNLYWALTMLPRPMIDLRRAVEVERHSLELCFPELSNLESIHDDSDGWRDRVYGLVEKIEDLGLMSEMGRHSGIYRNSATLNLLAVKSYPRAKQSLIQQGFSEEVVESMPVGQVLLIDLVRTFERIRDDAFKWFYVPFDEAREGMKRARAELDQSQEELREVLPLANAMLPPLMACRNAVVRTERNLAAMRVIEALRLHAHENGGKLPERLEDVTVVPVPPNPATGKPFSYRLENDTAILELPKSDGVYFSYRYEIKIRPPGEEAAR